MNPFGCTVFVPLPSFIAVQNYICRCFVKWGIEFPGAHIEEIPERNGYRVTFYGTTI